jgi:Uma2 family endonuclease
MAAAKTGARFPVLGGVTYDDYVRFRDDPVNDGLRMTYHNGSFVVVSPKYRHERPASDLGMIVRAAAAVFKVPYLETASTTFRRGTAGTRKGSGKEPDRSFYFAHAAAIWNVDDIDLEIHPPPDLWIEVDNRGSSAGRLPLYVRLKVPEVWRYRARKGTLWFGRLVGDHYEEIERSLSLPMLTRTVVLELLANALRARDAMTWDEETRAWLRDTLKPAYEANR